MADRKAPVATGKETPGSTLATTTPEEELASFFGEAKGEGLELVRADDIVIPRLSIVQPTSPSVKERTAGPGDIINVITKANYGEKGIKFVPLFFWGSRIEWSSPDPGATMVCIARDGEHGSVKDAAHGNGNCEVCPKRQFSDDNGVSKQPACTDYKNVLLIPLPDGESPLDQHPVVYSAKRAALGEFKKFLTAANGLRLNGIPLPLYSHTWMLKSTEEKNDKGSWYNPSFVDLGMITDMKLLKYLQSVCRDMKKAQDRFNIPEENESVEAQFVEHTSATY